MSLNLVDADFFLEENKFKQYCTEFLQYSQRIGDDWQWRSIKDSTDGYMIKTYLQLKNKSSSSGRVDIVNDESTFLSFEASWSVFFVHVFVLKLETQQQWEESSAIGLDLGCIIVTSPCVNTGLSTPRTGVQEGLEDSQEAGVSEVSEVIRYEYHVLYSCSYQAPVLYFRAGFLDGKPLTLDEIWKSVHECYRDRLWQGPWDTITQQEHPLLGQPFFVLHPCRTNEFMSSILSNLRKQKKHTNYIISWLSVVGPVVGLHLPLSYAEANLDETTAAD